MKKFFNNYITSSKISSTTSSSFYENISSDINIQGGTYCLAGTRITMPSIEQYIREGKSIDSIVDVLNSYYDVDDISKDKIEEALDEYNTFLGLYNSPKIQRF